MQSYSPTMMSPAKKYANDVVTLATNAGAASVKIVRFPGLDEGGDIFDLIKERREQGATDAEIREEIEQFADAADFVAVECEPAKVPLAWREFPIEHLPKVVRRFATEGAKAIGCNVVFIILPLLAGLASAIGNTRRIYLKRRWSEPAIVWAVPVAPSGWKKSPPLELSLRCIRSMNRRAMKQYATKMVEYEAAFAEYEKAKSAWHRDKRAQSASPTAPDKPVPTRPIIDDTTIEKVAHILRDNWRGTLLARDELSGLFGSFDRYASARGGDMAKWIEMHAGRSLQTDRVSTGHIYVDRASVSITGTIQPAILAKALSSEMFASGFVSRLLFAAPPRQVEPWTEADVSEAAEDAMDAVFEALFSLEPAIDDVGDPTPALLTLDPAAKALWVKFYNEHATAQVELDGDIGAAWSKLEGYAARLALILHLVRWASGETTADTIVDATSMEAGIVISRWFGREAERVYAALAESPESRKTNKLLAWIKRKGGNVTARDVTRALGDYATMADAEAALTKLANEGHGSFEYPKPDAKGGHTPRRFILKTDNRTDTCPVSSPQTGQASSVGVSVEESGNGDAAEWGAIE